MSRYRTIHCLVWNDDKFPFAPDDVQLVWFHLKTTPLSTPLGIFKAPLEGLAAEKHWTVETYRETFAKGLDLGFWKYDERSHVVYFPNYFRWNRPENPNVLLGWLRSCWDELPDCNLKQEAMLQLFEACRDWGAAYIKVWRTFAKRSPNVRQTGTGTGTGNNTKKEKAPAPKAKQPIPRKRAPEEFEVTSEMRKWAAAEAPGVDVNRETAKFKDYEFAKPRTDWLATWRNWIRTAAERSGTGADPRDGGQHGAGSKTSGIGSGHNQTGPRKPFEGAPPYVVGTARKAKLPGVPGDGLDHGRPGIRIPDGEAVQVPAEDDRGSEAPGDAGGVARVSGGKA